MKRLTSLIVLLLPVLASAQDDFRLEAHRGICNRYPENTVLSFKMAAKEPVYAGIETDVQMTSDGVLVLMHDPTLDRTTDATGAVSDYTWKELRHKVHIDGGYGWCDGKWAGHREVYIPTFKSYLKICRRSGKMPYVELKLLTDEGIVKTIEMLHRMGFKDDEFVLTSTTMHYLELAGELCGAKREFMKKKFTPEEIEEIARKDSSLVIRPAATHLRQDVVDKCRELGLEMEAYVLPVGDRALLQQLKDWGVKGVTCNDWIGL